VKSNQPQRQTVANLETINANWLAKAKAQSDLTQGVTALAARIGADCTRGTADIEELWRLVRLARTLG
jgi:hypothetical protein